MYLGPTWPLAGGVAAARAGASGGRGVLTAAIGAAVVPLGFVLGRELQRRLGRGARPVPVPVPVPAPVPVPEPRRVSPVQPSRPGRPTTPIRPRPALPTLAGAAMPRRYKGPQGEAPR
ncbi:hypothetical protein OEIGOIKO_07111 [Streptomyces chrestomyceticus JCM 4735]|uniref:Uncharacterized protein n=1 Tax=Streptomyces chrestomyceticus JCM 4735 TaxID=1306181 RepID=A0A7U9L1E6_9ACTN|nr:hypothetical protein OEIGOIKO_07111 [Streptomyces chrestomyceticus JCM 4735]